MPAASRQLYRMGFGKCVSSPVKRKWACTEAPIAIFSGCTTGDFVNQIEAHQVKVARKGVVANAGSPKGVACQVTVKAMLQGRSPHLVCRQCRQCAAQRVPCSRYLISKRCLSGGVFLPMHIHQSPQRAQPVLILPCGLSSSHRT